MSIRNSVVTVALLAVVPGAGLATELQRATTDAWSVYVRAADARMAERAADGKQFLWIDESAERQARVRGGDIVVTPAVKHGTVEAPAGLIHDWIGGVFVPSGTIASLRGVIQDYEAYPQVFAPVVRGAKRLPCDGEAQAFSMTWERHVLFVDAAMETQYRARDFVVDPGRGYNITESTRIQEIENYGRASQRMLAPDTGSGFVWRIRSIARYEERDGGLYFEMEAMALTRDVPGSLRWLVNPVMNHLSVNSLTATLREIRQAMVTSQTTDMASARDVGGGAGVGAQAFGRNKGSR